MKLIIPAVYDKDSKAFYRFTIKSKRGIVGSVYVPKAMEIPDRIVLSLKTARNEGKGESNR